MLASIVFAILVLAIMFLCGRLTANFAAQRGRSRAAWFAWGALCFPIPSIVLALLPSRGRDDGSSSDAIPAARG